jgi:putative phosphoesterase
VRRIALISDIHGNLTALEAVLADVGASEADDTYCLGDLVGYGPDPVGVIDRVRSLGIPTVRGNYDEGVGLRRGECGCYYANEQARLDGAASYAFTEALVDDERAWWLAGLPRRIQFWEQGARVLLTHGSPRKINEYLMFDRSDSQLARLAEEAGADVVAVGHTHAPYHRHMAGETNPAIHYINAGSVGRPKDGDWHANWTELLIGDEAEVTAAAPEDLSAGPAGQGAAPWVAAVVHRVVYDVASVQAAVRAAGLPERLAAALCTA